MQLLPPKLSAIGALDHAPAVSSTTSTAAVGEAADKAATLVPAAKGGELRPTPDMERLTACRSAVHALLARVADTDGEHYGLPSTDLALGMAVRGAAAPCPHTRDAEGGGVVSAPVLQSELRDFTQRTIEYLKYFYASFPLSLHPGARERVQKLNVAMAKLSGELDAFKRCLPKDSPAMSSAVVKHVAPLQYLLALGQETFEREVVRKTTSS